MYAAQERFERYLQPVARLRDGGRGLQRSAVDSEVGRSEATTGVRSAHRLQESATSISLQTGRRGTVSGRCAVMCTGVCSSIRVGARRVQSDQQQPRRQLALVAYVCRILSKDEPGCRAYIHLLAGVLKLRRGGEQRAGAKGGYPPLGALSRRSHSNRICAA